MVNGYTGKILRINLTSRKIAVIETARYSDWVGGHGIGSAIFWDLATEKSLTDGFDPKNVITIMTSPLTGTGAPSTSRTEMQGIGVHTYPQGWFTRSNFGGSFGPQLKFAGWDGIVIEGKADSPVWLNIVDSRVSINDALKDGLWGLDTWQTEQLVHRLVTRNHQYRDWLELGDAMTTQRPAVICIGQAGENLCRIASVTHGAGSGGGQGGFGGVWGSKNLKAISVIGTRSVPVDDAAAILALRAALLKNHIYNVDNPAGGYRGKKPGWHNSLLNESSRVAGCTACVIPCRRRGVSGTDINSICVENMWYSGRDQQVKQSATDRLQQYGINAMEAKQGLSYIISLYKMGILGPGKTIDSSPLRLDEILNGTGEGALSYIEAVADRQGIGDDLSEGLARAAVKWDRYEEDTTSGLLPIAGHGALNHHWAPMVYWGYGSILSDRDINEHCFLAFPTAFMEADSAMQRFTEKMVPFNDPFMADCSWQGKDGSNMARAKATGIYSASKAKLVAWQRYESRFWKESVLFCDSFIPVFFGGSPPDYQGYSPEMEETFFQAVTGRHVTYAGGLEIGRKILNLDRAIWVLEGRHRDMEIFTPYMYKPGSDGNNPAEPETCPVYDGTKWAWKKLGDMFYDREAVEEWKTRYYAFEGWDPKTGWPTRNTLAALGLASVAEELEKQGKTGL